MKLGTRILGCAILLPALLQAQTAPQPARLRITLEKRHYRPGESVVATYQIKNLTKGLLCFPPPSLDCSDLADGGLAAEATPPKGVAEPPRNAGCAADRLTENDPGEDIDLHWIKLRRHRSYWVTHRSDLIRLTAPGEWSIEAGYVPMSQTTWLRYQSALQARRCSPLPELHSPKVIVKVK